MKISICFWFQGGPGGGCRQAGNNDELAALVAVHEGQIVLQFAQLSLLSCEGFVKAL